MAGTWHYAKGDKRLGPVAADELKAMAADGRLQRGDLVWTDGMPDWKPAGDVIADAFTGPPPLPGEADGPPPLPDGSQKTPGSPVNVSVERSKGLLDHLSQGWNAKRIASVAIGGLLVIFVVWELAENLWQADVDSRGTPRNTSRPISQPRGTQFTLVGSWYGENPAPHGAMFQDAIQFWQTGAIAWRRRYIAYGGVPAELGNRTGQWGLVANDRIRVILGEASEDYTFTPYGSDKVTLTGSSGEKLMLTRTSH
jgi:hypothetical protein